MVLIIQQVLIVVTGILVALGLIPSHAIAPETTVPTPIVVQVATTTHPEPVATQTPTATQPKPVVQAKPPVQTGIPVPGTPEYEKALADARAALDKINASPAATSTPSLNDTVRNALVNIVCLSNGSTIGSISASGTIIDPRGIILTNAHVAQFWLLKDYPSKDSVSCIIRTGSPATPQYTATLLFIPPSWIVANAHKITQASPTGSGEHDYALLVITGMVNKGATPPLSFSYLPLTGDIPAVGDQELVAGYAAGFLGGITIQKALYASSANATVGTLYTFGTNTPDVFSVGGTIVSQHGASGGPVADRTGSLIGTIVTATDGADTSSRDLRAISTNYILRDFPNEAGTTLPAFLAGNILAEAATFNLTIAPTLTKELTDALNR